MVSPRVLNLASTYQIVASALLFAFCLFLWMPGVWGVVAGSVLTSVNFWAMRYLANRTLLAENPKLLHALLLAVKFVVVIAVLGTLVLVFDLHPVGLVLGMGTLLLGIFAATAHVAFSARLHQS